MPARQVTDYRVLAALAHPLRRRLLDVLRVDGPCTASMLAEQTGQAVGNISHHVKVLASHGLVEPAPELARDRRERWWRSASTALRWSTTDFADDPAAEAASLAASALGLQRQLDLTTSWLQSDAANSAEWQDAAFNTDTWLRLTSDELSRLGEEMLELVDRYRDRAGDGGDATAGADRKPVFFLARGFPGPAMTGDGMTGDGMTGDGMTGDGMTGDGMTGDGMTGHDIKGNGLRSDGTFRLIWLGTASSRLGSSVASVATPLVALEVLDASAFTISLLMAAAWVPWLLIGLPAGAWVDRLAKRPVMIVSDAVAAVAVVSVPLAAWWDVLTVAHLLIAAVVIGTATVFFQTAWTSYLPAVLDQRQLVPANAFLYGSESAAQVAGPGLAGLLAGAFGAVAGLLVQAGTFVVSAVCLVRVRRPERRTSPTEPPNLRREIVEGARFVASDRFLRNLAVHGALSNLWLVGYQALLVVFLVREVGLGAATVGLLLTLTALGGVVGASLAPSLSRRLGSARTLVFCKAGAGPCALLIPLTASGVRTGLFVIGSALVITGVVAGNVVSGSFRQTYCPPHLLSRVTTSMQFVNLGTIPLGAVAAGALASVAGVRASLWVMTAGFALSALVLVLGPLRGRRDLPPPVWSGQPEAARQEVRSGG